MPCQSSQQCWAHRCGATALLRVRFSAHPADAGLKRPADPLRWRGPHARHEVELKGVALCGGMLPRRSRRQGAALLTTRSFLCSLKSRCREPVTAALRREGNPRGQSRPGKNFKDFIMTTLYVREGDNYREAGAQDVLDRANAL